MGFRKNNSIFEKIILRNKKMFIDLLPKNDEKIKE